MTTEVSRSPLVGSAIESLIYNCVEVSTKPLSIDPRRTGCGLGERRAEHEAPWPNGPQFRNRCAVSRYDYRAARLYFAQYSSRLIAQLTLRDGAVHGADCSTCSVL
jgi:hypothetical protein